MYSTSILRLAAQKVMRIWTREIEITEMPDHIIAEHYENPSNNVFSLHANEYLVLKKNGKKIDEVKRWNESTKEFERLRVKEFAVDPKDDYQACALDLLCNRDVPIKIICGGFGAGKTFLSCQQLFSDYKNGKYNKL